MHHVNQGQGKSHNEINLTLCENPLPPIDEAMEAAKRTIPSGNYYTEKSSPRLKERISEYVNVPTENIHTNVGSELILRQIFSKYGKKVHLISPTYYIFEEIAKKKTYTTLSEKAGFEFDMKNLEIPKDTTLAVVINPNNPNGGIFDIKDNLDVVKKNPNTLFLIDEAFIEFGGKSSVDLIFDYNNIIVTRTFSKAFSLAGLRVGYAISNKNLIKSINKSNDPFGLGIVGEKAAIASLENIDKIKQRVHLLKKLARELAESLSRLDITCYPTETYFFLMKVNFMNNDKFTRLLSDNGIHVRTISVNSEKFMRFPTSTKEKNRRILDVIKGIHASYQ